MKDPHDDAKSELEARAKRTFDDSVDDIDASIRSRLTQARYAALAHAENGTAVSTGFRRYWLPAAGLAVATLIAALFVLPRVNGSAPGAPATFAEDMPMLLEPDSMELVEDLEFYASLGDDALDSNAPVNDADDPSLTIADPARS